MTYLMKVVKSLDLYKNKQNGIDTILLNITINTNMTMKSITLIDTAGTCHTIQYYTLPFTVFITSVPLKLVRF